MSATEMQAGRELDALIAERVMGATWERGYLAFPDGVASLAFRNRDHVVYDGLPHYSTDIAAAWTVLDALTDCRFVVERAANGKSVVLVNSRRAFSVESAPTAPHAICLAALAYAGSLPPRPTGGEE